MSEYDPSKHKGEIATWHSNFGAKGLTEEDFRIGKSLGKSNN